jgi:hypothetical protein
VLHGVDMDKDWWMESSLQSNTTTTQAFAKRRSLVGYLWVSARGFCMGSADVVPGVSGGTMAFILGIYEELVESIRMGGRPVFGARCCALICVRPCGWSISLSWPG